MTEASTPIVSATPGKKPTAATAPIMTSTLVGCVVAAVLGWTLLSAALWLPAMLGVFFFMLFGLIIGSVMYRIAARVRPVSRRTVIIMSTATALTCWSVSLVKEYADFENDFAEAARPLLHVPKTGDAHEQVAGELRTFAGEYLKEHYPPGGLVGYMTMAATGGSIVIDELPTSQPKPVTVQARAAAWVWCTRAAIALMLAFAAIYSVVVELTKPAPEPKSKPKVAPAQTESVVDSQDGHRPSPKKSTQDVSMRIPKHETVK